MALGGVETGSMKPNEAESATPTATGTGLNPAERAVPMASGPIMLVAAVYEVSSDRSSDITQNTATNSSSDGLPPIMAIIWSRFEDCPGRKIRLSSSVRWNVYDCSAATSGGRTSS